jgi:hypothetical protein
VPRAERGEKAEPYDADIRELHGRCKGNLVRVCAFRTKAITDSGACRSPIPTEADHRFRSMPIAERTVM